MAAALVGCSAPVDPPVPTPAPRTAATHVPDAGAAQQVLTEVLRAARQGDRAAFQAQLSPRDPVFADRARQLFDNLRGLPLTELESRLQPERRSLTPVRQQLLGADAWVEPATVTWRLSGDTAAAEHRLWFTFVPAGGGVQLAGLIDRPTTEPVAQQPGWWLGPVSAGRQDGVTVVVGAGQSTDPWLSRGRRALAQVRRQLPVTVGAAENPTLVLEVPATTADFEGIVGVPAGSYADIAAVTLAEGPAAAALRVVLNPDAVRRLTPDGLGLTLTHETVHVVTGSPRSPAPAWAVEGLADWVGLQAYPKAGPAVAASLLAEVAEHGAPAALPADADFAADAKRLDLAYAEAWFGCRSVVSTSGREGLGRLYRELDAGRTLDQAAQSALGISGSRLTADWRRYLRARAGLR